jgi:hypothetical protein
MIVWLPRPDRIFVYDFAASPDDVEITKGIIAELEHMVKKLPLNQRGKSRGRLVANAV